MTEKERSSRAGEGWITTPPSRRDREKQKEKEGEREREKLKGESDRE